MYGFHQVQLLSNMAIGIFTLRQQLRGLLSKNWTGTIKTPYVEYLVVGGGGAGNEGGGGGGGVVTGLLPVTTGTTYTATVGGGGNATGPVAGVNSSLGSITAVGGASAVTAAGGSGCGSGWSANAPSQGVFGQGNTGGTGTGTSSSGTARAGGGGGGAGTVGLNAVAGATAIPGNGGAGIASAISGTVTPYGGGGGAGGAGNGGDGGIGGGGVGSTGSHGTATVGAANTGGGGGGGYYAGAVNGGSGIVIVSYPDIYAPLTTGGATSPTVSTSGSGSISFAGSQAFSYSAATPLALGTSNFTFETWFYKTNSSNVSVLTQTTGGLGIEVVPSNGTIDISFAGSSYIVRATQAVTLSTWNHLAVTRNGNAFTVYYNGNQIGTATNAGSFTNNTTQIGGSGGADSWVGYMSNMRLVKGVVVYTGAFASYVPTAPLTATQSAGPSGSNIAAITGTATSLLLNSVSGSYLADSSTNSYTASSVTGPPTWNQSSPFATGLGYKNRVYTWAPTVSAGGTATGTFTV